MQARLKIANSPYYFEIPELNGFSDLIIGIPCFTRDVNIPWVNALRALEIPKETTFQYASVQGNNKTLDFTGDYNFIGPARDAIVRKAQTVKSKYLFFIDDDVEIPPYAFNLLYRALKQYPQAKVCAGIYRQKNNPPIPVVWDLDGDDIEDWEPRNSIFECSAIGAGCMLIDTSVFQKLPSPWFYPTPQGLNDDKLFCNKIRKLGYKVLAHGGVLCTHWAGLKPYKMFERIDKKNESILYHR